MYEHKHTLLSFIFFLFHRYTHIHILPTGLSTRYETKAIQISSKYETSSVVYSNNYPILLLSFRGKRQQPRIYLYWIRYKMQVNYILRYIYLYHLKNFFFYVVVYNRNTILLHQFKYDIFSFFFPSFSIVFFLFFSCCLVFSSLSSMSKFNAYCNSSIIYSTNFTTFFYDTSKHIPFHVLFLLLFLFLLI